MKAKYNPATQDAEIEADLEEVSSFLGKITPDFVEEAGGIIHDQVRYWRWKNQIKIVKKAEDLLQKEPLLHKVSLKVLVPLIENASLEDEDSLQNKWAAMLANAATQSQTVLPLFPALLKELSSIEVLILDNLYEVYAELQTQPVQFDKNKIKTNSSIKDDEIDVIVENLFRLNICSSPGSVGSLIGDYPFSVHTNEIFELTALGIAFIKSCKFIPSNKS